ncbi:IQGA1 protein, partial [Oxylabes madagascariensis]|nr:IQGA1 protein [Oxylabes madagascariensis]
SDRYIDDLVKLKAERNAQGNEFITWNDIQSCVDHVNKVVSEEHESKFFCSIHARLYKEKSRFHLTGIRKDDKCARAYASDFWGSRERTLIFFFPLIYLQRSSRFSLGILAINEAVDHGDVSQTLSALRSPDVGLYGVTPECAETYQQELSEVKKRAAGGNGSEWVKHWVRGGYHYYHNLRTKEGGWDEPAEFVQNDSQLSREEIQSTISGVTAAYNREQLWLANENLIMRLQACCRGYLVRQEFNSRMNFLKKQVPAITCIQACCRGYLVRQEFNSRMNFLKKQVPAITCIQIQSMTRMYQARRRYRDRLQYFRNHINDVVKIQAFIRANKAREDYKTLINAENPPMAVVRKFVHLLDQSDQDFQEELELMKLREEVLAASGVILEALRVKSVPILSFQDVVSHSKKLTKKNKEQLSDMMMLNKQRGGLKALSKEKREKLEAYQHLFYLLQTNPTYLAKLIFQMPQNKSTKFMDSVIFTLYNYASNQREEYLLLRLFQTALQEEIKYVVAYGTFLLLNQFWQFLKLRPNRGDRGQNALRQILAPVVKEIIDDKSLNIKTDPVDIYKSWVNQMESQTGEASKLPYDVTPEQALSHEEVRTRLDASIRNMRTVTDKFLSAIISSVDKIPYGMRFIAKVLKDSLHDKFPDAGEDELLKIVGNLLYYRYMNPAIVAPDAFDIIDLSAGGQLTTDQRRNLGSIAKMLQHAASNKMFMGDNAHLSIINEYLLQSYQKFRRFFQAACEVPELQDKFNIDEYSDLVTLTKPVIYISIGEIINTHTLLLDHQDAIAPEHNDPIHELLDDLGEVPTIESLIGGEGSGNVNDPSREMLAKTEVSLTLTNKFDVPGDENAEMDARTILLNTKRLIVDVIRFQPGETLTEILETSATSEQEAEHHRAMQKRAIRDAKTPDKMKKSVSVKEDGNLNLQEKKEKIKAGLKKLTELGPVNAKNKYQELINDIAKDIRNQRRYRQRRKAELVKLQQTYSALNSKATFYGEQVDYYKSYIKTCLDNLASKGKVSKKPREMKGKNSKKISLKYTAARLHEKGVLLEIEDLQSNQFKNVIFEISPTEEVGDFEVKAKFMGVQMETFMLHYQ